MQSKQEWLTQDHTKTLVKLLNVAKAEMTEYMSHKDRIGADVDSTAQAFCYSSGFVQAIREILDRIESTETMGEDPVEDPEVEGQEYSDEYTGV